MKSKYLSFMILIVIIGVIFISGCAEKKKETQTKTIAECEQSRDKDACYQRIAIENKDTDLCKRITSSTSKNGCYYFIAIKAKDNDPCKKITDDWQETACYAIVANDSSICEQVTDSFGKQVCYLNFAKRTKPLEEKPEEEEVEPAEETAEEKCEEITDSSRREGCLSFIKRKE